MASDTPRFCPKCAAGIARSVIGVEVRRIYDGVLYWKCPDCGHPFHRWPQGDRLRAKAEEFVRQWEGTAGEPTMAGNDATESGPAQADRGSEVAQSAVARADADDPRDS